jgi:hypothetical protein
MITDIVHFSFVTTGSTCTRYIWQYYYTYVSTKFNARLVDYGSEEFEFTKCVFYFFDVPGTSEESLNCYFMLHTSSIENEHS